MWCDVARRAPSTSVYVIVVMVTDVCAQHWCVVLCAALQGRREAQPLLSVGTTSTQLTLVRCVCVCESVRMLMLCPCTVCRVWVVKVCMWIHSCESYGYMLYAIMYISSVGAVDGAYF